MKPQKKNSVLAKIQNVKNETIAKAGMFIVEQIAHSSQAREQLAIIPMSIMAAAIKCALNFLIMYRLATGSRWVDFFISLCLSATVGAVSPIFFAAAKRYEPEIVKFTNHVADHSLMPHGKGVEYLTTWRNRGVVGASLVAIAFLSVVEVDSWYLIQTIAECLVSFWVVDQVNQFRDSLYLPVEVRYKTEFHPRPQPTLLTQFDFIKIPLHRAKIITPSPSAVIHEYKPPKRAVRISCPLPMRECEEPKMVLQDKNVKRKKVAGSQLRILDDWVRM